ncbi:MAG: FkbM family methyltransferase [Nitrospirota bacterium]|nr:MAG: FkbM family methyltransferase [Nitrospirota bacterium]
MRILRLLIWSIKLDVVFLLNIKGIHVWERVWFILIKYLYFVKDKVTGIRNKPARVSIFNREYYYDNIYGLSSLQRVYCESYEIKEWLASDPIVIDIGAHTGQFNFFCSHYLTAERVISVEPLTDCYEILKLNARNPNDCINCAIGITDDTVTMFIPEISSQHSTYIKDDNEKYRDSVDVKMKRLDDIMAEHLIDKCDLLKIDTEGSEYDVLVSAVNTLTNVDKVLVEMSVFRRSSGNMFVVGSYLQENGFRLAKLLPVSKDMQFLDGLFERDIR